MIEAIETLFVPACVHNNAEGADARALRAFGEPPWNNPVTRIVGGDRKDVVARNAGGWSVAAVTRQMRTALEKRGKDVPTWLRLLSTESAARRHGVETAVFGMP